MPLKLGGRHADKTFESLCEVALVCETSLDGNLAKRHLRSSNQLAREIDTELADIFPYSAVVLTTKSVNEVIGMDVYSPGNLFERECVCKPGMEEVSCLEQPVGRG